MKAFLLITTSLLAAATAGPARAASQFQHFITAKGDQLMEGERPFRFISFNIPNLHLVEDNVPFAETIPWRLPDRFEITDALESVRQQGGTVVRTYVISVARTNDEPAFPRHVRGPGKFDEAAFRALDLVLEVANQTGVRVIIPLVDNWSWWGGAAEYAGFRGKPKAAFWTDAEVIADFKETIRYVLSRPNTLSGIPYREDKAILAWETGNELESPPAWTRQIASYIKSLAPHHLVIDGFHTTALRQESLDMPEVDVVTTHHYPGGNKPYHELVLANWEKAKGRKPYFVGEFGFVATAQIEAMLDAVIQTGTSGALIWSLRYRSRDGGFYWHSEPMGGNLYKAYHWPGFATAADYDEKNVLALLQRKAFEIRGLPVPPPTPPAPPRLLPISDPAAITWQGSVGATSYTVARSTGPNGLFVVVSDSVDESAVQYRPLFADTEAPKGTWYYRVWAQNQAGKSPPSAAVGPVQVTQATLVDELVNASQIHAQEGALEFKTRDCRKAREDSHRVAGKPGSALVYRVAGPLRSARLYAFFPGQVADFRFSVSPDGRAYTEVPSEKKSHSQGAGDYGYWTPVLYEAKVPVPGARFVKIEFRAEAQIGRVEIAYQN